jgi:DNA-binding GntR family transcriptional regulator
MASERSLFDPLWMRVADPLRRAILLGVLPPGKLLSENSLAAEYGVSRTPVREALRLLMEENLVEMLPGRKVRVVQLRLDDVREIYDVRWVLEAEAIRRLIADPDGLPATLANMEEACASSHAALSAHDAVDLAEANERFHAAIVAALKNTRLISEYANIQNLITLCRHQSLRTPSWAEAGTADHRELLDLLRSRDEHAALTLLRRHIDAACKVVCNSLGGATSDVHAA